MAPLAWETSVPDLRSRLDAVFLEHGQPPPQNIVETASLPVIIHLLRHSDMLTAPAHQLDIALMTNGLPVAMRDLTPKIVDLLLAETSLYAAKRDYANARYDYVINSLRLQAFGVGDGAGDHPGAGLGGGAGDHRGAGTDVRPDQCHRLTMDSYATPTLRN